MLLQLLCKFIWICSDIWLSSFCKL